MERVLELNAELAFPSAKRLQSALLKEGITLPIAEIKDITSKTGSRQVLQPPPSYKGNITSNSIDDRWAADLLSFESRPANRPEHNYRHVLLVQDIFSRFLWAEAIATKTQVRAAFERIIENRKPRELNTDKGPEFTSREFQAMLDRRKIQHRLKVGLNDIATLDRAMGVIKAMLAKREAEMGGDWLTHLQPVINAYNKLDNQALHEHAPGEVQGDDELRFQLRVENANKHHDNVRQAEKRQEKLEDLGAFRTLKEPMSFKRRAGIPNWSNEVHAVTAVDAGMVTDTQGRRHDTRIVLPVSRASTIPGQMFAGGSAPRDEHRQVHSQRFLKPLREVVARAGSISMSQASKAMMQKEGFRRTLNELRMNFRSFVQLWPDFTIAGSGPATRLTLNGPLPVARSGTLLDYALHVHDDGTVHAHEPETE